jgi:hypothetical protein
MMSRTDAIAANPLRRELIRLNGRIVGAVMEDSFIICVRPHGLHNSRRLVGASIDFAGTAYQVVAVTDVAPQFLRLEVK